MSKSPTAKLNLAPFDLGRKSIRAQLALLVLAAVVPAFAGAFAYLIAERENAKQDARAQVKVLVDNAVYRLSSDLRVHEVLLETIAAQAQVRAMRAGSCDAIMESYARQHPEYVTLAVRDLEGNPVCSYRPSPATRQQLVSAPWFQQSLKAGKFRVSDAAFASEAGRWVTILTMPVHDDAGRQTGIVVLPLDLLTLGKSVFGVVPDPAVVAVTDRQSNILMRSLHPEQWVSKPIPGIMQDFIGSEGFTARAGADGIRRLFVYKLMPETGWRVSAGLPESEVFADADRALRNGLLGCAAILLFALAVAWRLAWGLVRPLDELAATAVRVASGDVDARAPVNVGSRELEVVARAFNHMLDAQRTAAQVLRESEESLSVTLQSIGDGVIATDANGRVTRMNPVAERLTGWSLANACGRSLNKVFRIVNATTREPAVDPAQRVLDSGNVVGLANHTALLARGGGECQISDSAAPIRDNFGNTLGVVMVFSDVSEQYRMQQLLADREKRYRTLVETTPVGIALHQDGIINFVNPMALRILGARSADQVLGRSAIDFVHPAFRARVLRRADQIVAIGTVSSMMEVKYLRLDGTAVDVQSQGIAVSIEGKTAIQVSFIDISVRVAAEKVLRENEARFRALTELSSDWYWEQDDHFRFVRVDGNLWVSTGRPNRERIGKTRWEIGDLRLTPAEWEAHRKVLEAHQPFRDFELHFRDDVGRPFWVSVSGGPIVDAQGMFRGYRGVGRDITAQKAAADQIHALAFYDALTELPNRRLLIEQLKKAMVSHARSHLRAALLFIDLDHFKTLNDTLGHETGDELLRQVARRLQGCVREADSVARLGGDEFVVMLENLSQDLAEASVQADGVSQKILAAFVAPFDLGAHKYRSTSSIGVTLFGRDHKGVDELLKQADVAMYQAKAAGRNTVRVFDDGMQAAVDVRAALESDLRDGLAKQQMLLHFQPVIGAQGAVTGAEALVRWQHPVRGRVKPIEFIPIAEATRLILPLGQWVLETACRQLVAWDQLPATRHLTLAVNVSAHQFVEDDFVANVLRALDEIGADPRRLKLELTESLLAENTEQVIAKMSALRERGIDFSLDDFGTGYSSLSYLKRLPLAQLKIDQSFVRDVLVDPNDAAIARTIIALGASLGLAVIAEGVETEGQHEFLLNIGCSSFQGYLFGRPMPIGEFDQFFSDHQVSV